MDELPLPLQEAAKSAWEMRSYFGVTSAQTMTFDEGMWKIEVNVELME